MKLRHYIAMDMHCSHTTLEAQTRAGHVVRRLDLATETKVLIDAVKSISGPRGVREPPWLRTESRNGEM